VRRARHPVRRKHADGDRGVFLLEVAAGIRLEKGRLSGRGSKDDVDGRLTGHLAEVARAQLIPGFPAGESAGLKVGLRERAREARHRRHGSSLLVRVVCWSCGIPAGTLVRLTASMAGIERDAVAEYLVPEHLAFVLYAAARGDFVLGGMQALFEHDLHLLLKGVSKGGSRCALDPGCRRHGAACVACLHVGEPSCRHFNRFLNRDTLFNPSLGFLSTAGQPKISAP
jgi:hypothetical protein